MLSLLSQDTNFSLDLRDKCLFMGSLVSLVKLVYLKVDRVLDWIHVYQEFRQSQVFLKSKDKVLSSLVSNEVIS